LIVIAAFLGAVGVGVTVTTMNPTYRPEEIARQLENSGARYTDLYFAITGI
jgi:acyl-CoA synthetase (AMP-forming)/AMP-acid ligase II